MVNYMVISSLVMNELRKSELKESDMFAIDRAIHAALVQYEQELKKQNAQNARP